MVETTPRRKAISLEPASPPQLRTNSSPSCREVVGLSLAGTLALIKIEIEFSAVGFWCLSRLYFTVSLSLSPSSLVPITFQLCVPHEEVVHCRRSVYLLFHRINGRERTWIPESGCVEGEIPDSRISLSSVLNR